MRKRKTKSNLDDDSKDKLPPKTAEPKPAPILECPPALSPVARKEWDRVVGELTRLGVLSSFDRGPLAAYCTAYALWLGASEMVQKHGAMIKSPKGFPIQSPYLSTLNRQAEIMIRIASEFGFTPASRSRNFSFTRSNAMLLEATVEDPLWPSVPQLEASEPRNTEIEIKADDNDDDGNAEW